jgi:serine/threonine-protein kinase
VVSEEAYGSVTFAVAANGLLVYLAGETGDANTTLVWVSRDGREEPIGAPPRPYFQTRISPDGTRVALDIRDQDNDVWLWDLTRETLTRLTSSRALDRQPIWTPDGQKIVFSSTLGGAPNLFWQTADGIASAERLTEGPNQHFPTSFSPDGTRLLLMEVAGSERTDIAIFPLTGERRSALLVHTPFIERNAEISPDGRWLAYQSNESGEYEVYVRPFPEVDAGRWQVSADRGTRPMWAPDGRELFYLVEPRRMMAVPINPGSTFSAGTPRPLFEGPYLPPLASRTFDISRDGQRFLMIKENVAVTPRELVVVQNWTEELKRLVPTN